MDSRKTRDLPARLEGVRRRFERWRRTRKAHARIPDSLWTSAAIMAEAYGISRTATVLRVNYHVLKKRLGHRKAAAGRTEAGGEARFIELAPFAPSSPCECLLELEDAGGAKMRVRLQGIGMPDLTALSESFWNHRS